MAVGITLFGCILWLFSTSSAAEIRVAMSHCVHHRGQYLKGIPMNKLLIALIATLVAVSVSGCVGIGKGKAPPPIVTKG
jgi:hypothetical protein